MKSAAKNEWYQTWSNMETRVLALEAQSERSGPTADAPGRKSDMDALKALAIFWLEFGFYLGCNLERERKAYEAAVPRHCAWACCEYHHVRPENQPKACKRCKRVYYCNETCQTSYAPSRRRYHEMVTYQ